MAYLIALHPKVLLNLRKLIEAFCVYLIQNCFSKLLLISSKMC